MRASPTHARMRALVWKPATVMCVSVLRDMQALTAETVSISEGINVRLHMTLTCVNAFPCGNTYWKFMHGMEGGKVFLFFPIDDFSYNQPMLEISCQIASSCGRFKFF